MKPMLFIGSSTESQDVAHDLQEALVKRKKCNVQVWTQDIFESSRTALESLVSTLSKKDFAIFLFTPDDLVEMRGTTYETVRDNVVFELGLFIGVLGPQRCIVIEPEGQKKIRIPSDLSGFVTIKYDPVSYAKDPIPTLGPVANEISRKIQNLGCKHGDLHDESEWPRMLTRKMTWNNVTKGVSYFIDQARDFNPCVIVAVNRGGAIVANMAAKTLGYKAAYTVRTNGYREDHDSGIDAELIARPDVPKRIFVIDDVTDTGDEIREARQILEQQFPDSKLMICVFLKLKPRAWRGGVVDLVAYNSDKENRPPWDAERAVPHL